MGKYTDSLGKQVKILLLGSRQPPEKYDLFTFKTLPIFRLSAYTDVYHSSGQ